MRLTRSQKRYDDPRRQAVVDWYNAQFGKNEPGTEVDWAELLAEAVHAYFTAQPFEQLPPTNEGHGHVRPRADGVKMRCGGPAICVECAQEFSRSQMNRVPAKSRIERGT